MAVKITRHIEQQDRAEQRRADNQPPETLPSAGSADALASREAERRCGNKPRTVGGVLKRPMSNGSDYTNSEKLGDKSHRSANIERSDSRRRWRWRKRRKPNQESRAEKNIVMGDFVEHGFDENTDIKPSEDPCDQHEQRREGRAHRVHVHGDCRRRGEKGAHSFVDIMVGRKTDQRRVRPPCAGSTGASAGGEFEGRVGGETSGSRSTSAGMSHGHQVQDQSGDGDLSAPGAVAGAEQKHIAGDGRHPVRKRPPARSSSKQRSWGLSWAHSRLWPLLRCDGGHSSERSMSPGMLVRKRSAKRAQGSNRPVQA